MSTLARRWSDNDHYLGPFTYARDCRYRPLAVILASGDDEYPGASLRLSGFGHTLILALPDWLIRPYREKVRPKSWDAETVERLGRDWYWAIDRREFGVSLFEGFFQVKFGRQAMDSSKDQDWGCFLPWTQWRHVRRSFYGLQGEHVATIPDIGKPWPKDDAAWRTRHDHERELEATTPTVAFRFQDFDGEEITATTKIEEREWHFGEGWFKWLSWFRAPKISRDLDIRFSAETGRRKGSWKGGTVGHSIEMRPGELHEAAFRRYCDEHDMEFLGAA